MKVNADELTEASEEFLKASKDIELIIKRLNSTVNKLEDAWSDTNQQVFYQKFQRMGNTHGRLFNHAAADCPKHARHCRAILRSRQLETKEKRIWQD